MNGHNLRRFHPQTIKSKNSFTNFTAQEYCSITFIYSKRPNFTCAVFNVILANAISNGLYKLLAISMRSHSDLLQPYNIHVAHKPITTLRQLLTNVKEKDEANDR